MKLQPGTRLGSFEILSPLGAGGMGEVYRARDSRLGREVAIKVLPERLAADPEALARFEGEARALAALSHPNIVAIHDFGSQEGLVYTVTELLEGETLRSRIQKSPIPWRKAVEIASAVADGLAAAHARGIVHRDLKPENVFLTPDGRVKVLDFGLARLQPAVPLAEVSSVPTAQVKTEPGMMIGTIGYMAPEQARGEETTPASDIFSLGCLLYEMISGRRALGRPTAAETVAAILRDDPPRLSQSGREVPPELDRMVAHCLEKSPGERYQSAQDLAFELKELPQVSGARATLSDAGIRTRRPVWHAVLALALAIAAAGLALSLRRRPRELNSLAVLPLANVGADPSRDYLCDGITESLINTLSQLPKLRVMARSTVFRYKGRDVDPRAVGRELGVRAVFLGRLEQRGDILALHAELVDTDTGSQLWGAQYSRPMANVAALPEEVSREISDGLRMRLTGGEKERLAHQPTADSEAYQLYLKGRYHWNKRTEEEIRRGISFFEQAVEKDPSFALAHAGLADAYLMLGDYGYVLPRDAYPRAKAAATRALELDEALAEAHTSLGYVHASYDWTWPAAEKEFRRAIAINGGYAVAHQWYAEGLAMRGRFPEASAEISRALELDPLSLIITAVSGWILYVAHQPDRAIERFQRTLELDEGFYPAHLFLARALESKGALADAEREFVRAVALSGQSAVARAGLARARALAGRKAQAQADRRELALQSRDRYVSPYDLALVDAALGEADEAFRDLDRAFEDRSEWMAWLTVDPRLDTLRADPRLAALKRRVEASQ